MAYNWVSIMGNITENKGIIKFAGGSSKDINGLVQVNWGEYICDQEYGGGRITAQIEFKDSGQNSACGVMLYYDSKQKSFAVAGLGMSQQLCSVNTWSGEKCTYHAGVGQASQILPNRVYGLGVTARGSSVKIDLDGVEVIDATLPYSLPRGQAGIYFWGEKDILVSNYRVSAEPGIVFVVMQFTTIYNELYDDVIVPVCKSLGLAPVRGDETFGPGVIIADIAQKIIEAKVVIADITPANPNVYYEVGYAHALNKPTILVAEKDTKLPFDVSPYRVLFYENSIGGKRKVEDGLIKHLKSIQATPV